jgi:LuxR family maltose regulon positive regulatory protein
MVTNLLATKLRCPPLPPRRVQRPRLVQKLNAGLQAGRRITLISAPAGFGKTTCVSEWVNHRDYPVTWLSLDPADNDPERFFAYFVAALQKMAQNLGLEIVGMLRTGQLPTPEALSTILINDLLQMESGQTPFVVVLDDFHVIQDRLILTVMEKFVANLPPSLHLVLCTREDPDLPLARLRANNQLTEIRAGDLRFTRAEADHFLNETLALCLSQADIAILEDRAEGWIAGLQLAGLSVRDRADPSQFIATLSGSHRFILSYLTEEVLNHQSADTRQFLLETSILERLCGELCNAVTGRGNSHELLEQFFNANLFLISLDDEQHWYRYHHLFGELLRERQKILDKDGTRELHRRASDWYAQAGMIGEAIQHALTAGDYGAATQLLEEHATEMLIQGYVKTVEDWMQAIPAEWRAQNPRVNLAFAWKHLLHHDFPRAFPFIERLQALFAGFQGSEAPPAALQAEWLALQAMLLDGQGQAEAGLALTEQALTLVPEKEGYVRSLIYMGMAIAHQLLGDYNHSLEAYRKIIQYGQSGGSFICEMLGLSGLLQMVLQHGKYRLAFEVATQGIARIEQLGVVSPISAAVYGALGQCYYQWHQLDQLHPYFARTIQLSRLEDYSDAEISYDITRSRLALMAGDLEKSELEIRKAVDQMQRTPPAWVHEEVICQQVRVCLARGHLAEAEAALPPLGPLPAKITLGLGQLYNSALRIRLQRAQATAGLADLPDGIELAGQLLNRALQGEYIQTALETLVVRAQMHAALGNATASLADYALALELAEPEGYISLFVEEGAALAAGLEALLKSGSVHSEYIQRILAAFPNAQPAAVVPAVQNTISKAAPESLIESLTEREREVLGLIAEGLKYEEIATRLFISLNTVRTYVKGIYSKLNVNSRSQATALAHQYKLI